MNIDIQDIVNKAIANQLSEDPVTKAWRTGDLSYKVYDYQWGIKDALIDVINGTDLEKIEPYVLNCARRFGKTTLCCLTFIEECLKNPGHTYLFAAPTEKEAKDIILDVMPVLLEDAPEDYRPKFENNRYNFPNGSTIKVGGVYNGGETLRGKKAHGAVLDEAAHIKQTNSNNGLAYVFSSVIAPQLLTTNGWCLIASTPPPELAHDYVGFYNRARADNRLKHFSILDNPSITQEKREVIKQREFSIDPTGSSWKREYLAEFAIDTRTLIIPNFNKDIHTDVLLQENRPVLFPNYDRYVSYDHGTSDLSVFLFGYWNWEEATLYIEKELVLGNGAEKLSTREISQLYSETRTELWEQLPVFKEICDAINPQVIIDFNKDFQHRFVPPRKTNLEAMTNQLINLVHENKLKIDSEQCPLLVQTLEQGTWKTAANGRQEFNRLPGIGHCDAIAALVYMARGVNKRQNPHVRVTPSYNYENQYVVQQQQNQSEEHILSRALNIGYKKKKPLYR